MKSIKNIFLILICILTISIVAVAVSLKLIDKQNNPINSEEPNNTIITPTPNELDFRDMGTLTLCKPQSFDLTENISARFKFEIVIVDNYGTWEDFSCNDYQISVSAGEEMKLKVNGEEVAGKENIFCVNNVKGSFDIEVFGHKSNILDAQITVDLLTQTRDINIAPHSAKIFLLTSDVYKILPAWIETNSEKSVAVETFIFEDEHWTQWWLSPLYYSIYSWKKDEKYALPVVPGKTILRLTNYDDEAYEISLNIEEPLTLDFDEAFDIDIGVGQSQLFFKVDCGDFASLYAEISILTESEALLFDQFSIDFFDGEFNELGRNNLYDNTERKIWAYGLENICWIGIRTRCAIDTSVRIKVNKADVSEFAWYVDGELVKNNIYLEIGKTYELELKIGNYNEEIVYYIWPYILDVSYELNGNALTIDSYDEKGYGGFLLIFGQSNHYSTNYSLQVRLYK